MMITEKDFPVASRLTIFAALLIMSLVVLSMLYILRDAESVASLCIRIALIEACGVVILWLPKFADFEYKKAAFEGATFSVSVFTLLTVWAYPFA